MIDDGRVGVHGAPPRSLLCLIPHRLRRVPLRLLLAADGSLRPEFEVDCPEPYRRLAERCWHQEPE